MRTACPVGSTLASSARSLEHAELRLQLGGVAAERVERLADALLVVAVTGAPKLLDGRKRGQSRCERSDSLDDIAAHCFLLGLSQGR